MDPNAPQAAPAGGDQPDYVDKAFAGVAGKFGGAQGQKIAGDRAKSEKIVSSWNNHKSSSGLRKRLTIDI